MEKQQVENQQKERKDEKQSLEGLPKDSPYLDYKDLEEYKRKGYGVEGHLPPEAGRGPGATDAPTLSGASVSSETDVTATGAINRQGVP